MSKIFLIGDSHISLGYPNKAENWFKIHKEYFNNFLIPLLKREVNEGYIIVHLGDLFDNRNVIPIDLLNFGLEIVETISNIDPFHILVGNHDMYHKSSGEINTIKPFKYIPNVFIYDKTTQIKFCGKKILMMPYIESKKEMIKLINENDDSDYLFCHSDLNGARMHLTSVANKNNDKIGIEQFSKFKKVFSGHIHISQRISQFTFVGSNFEMDRNDMDNQKGIFVLDVESGDDTFIPNNISPKFKKVNVLVESDIDNLDNISTKDFIDLYISNSLIISSRKIRRKIEIILEKGNFASVEYIDDIKDNDDEEIMVESVDPESEDSKRDPIKLDYKDYIYDYINSQNYSSDKIKKGILNEYEE